MVILHIYGARAIFLLFYDDQDTENELCKIQTSTSQLIFTHKIYQSLYGKMIFIHYIIGGNTVVNIHIHGDRAIFLLFYDDQDNASG